MAFPSRRAATIRGRCCQLAQLLRRVDEQVDISPYYQLGYITQETIIALQKSLVCVLYDKQVEHRYGVKPRHGLGNQRQSRVVHDAFRRWGAIVLPVALTAPIALYTSDAHPLPTFCCPYFLMPCVLRSFFLPKSHGGPRKLPGITMQAVDTIAPSTSACYPPIRVSIGKSNGLFHGQRAPTLLSPPRYRTLPQPRAGRQTLPRWARGSEKQACVRTVARETVSNAHTARSRPALRLRQPSGTAEALRRLVQTMGQRALS